MSDLEEAIAKSEFQEGLWSGISTYTTSFGRQHTAMVAMGFRPPQPLLTVVEGFHLAAAQSQEPQHTGGKVERQKST